MFRLAKNITLAVILIACGAGGYARLTRESTTGRPDGIKVQVRDNHCKLIGPENRLLVELVADGTTFKLSSPGTLGTLIQGNRVKVIDEDGQTTLCDLDYNGSVITVTNVHGLKVTEVDVKLVINKATGRINNMP